MGLGKGDVVPPHQAYEHIWTQCDGESVGWTWQRNREIEACGMVLREASQALEMMQITFLGPKGHRWEFVATP